ncbi:pantetheine-phosphate adenylyltransferase [Moorella sulfitireducens (nom. illeg.)]|uniref:pantetheine-phosphate adenylyltransferase n=1 Tax=Neomoorella sulfitireducens TaxID=2972948 RepID=UPI0021AC5517|nr:pantetheine-phosphate adenylyltransferase [Moorella sulfitireducens]
MRTAICPRAHDPITYGHLDINEQAAAMFDRVVVEEAAKACKKVYLQLEKRVELARSACGNLSNVTVKPYRGLVVDFAMQEGATVIVRGLRAISDFECEMQAALMNKKLAGDIETIFLITATE